jgi:hypothetical protein
MRGRGAAMSNSDAVSIDSVIRAMYETISGAAGQPRQWERDRALHHPKALLIPARQAKGGPAGGVFSFDEFVASRAPFLEANDFYEIEIARREFRFGAIAHVLSFYEARKAPGGELLRRGVNSIQLMHDGERWWVMSVLWDNEREGVELPDLSSRA